MSWAKSQYDENPFSESSNDRANMISSYTPPVLNNSKLDTPPWLQEPSNSAKGGSATSASNLEEGKSGEEASSEVPRMILYTRIINLVLSVCMITVSLLALLTTQSATTGVLACYLTVFACLLCCFETHLKQVSKIIALNFGFMYSARARSVFMLFLGSILFSFSLFGKIVAVCMIANALFNMYILFKYPEYEAVQRQDAQSDIKDFLANNPAFAKQVVSAGVDVMRNNPELARQGAEAMFTGALHSQQQQSSQSRPMSSSGYSKVNNSDPNYASV